MAARRFSPSDFMTSRVGTWASSFLVQLRTRRRVGSVLLYGGVTLLPQLASGILAILYTRAFSPEEYANYGIFAAVYAAIAILLDLGLSSGIFRNYYSAGKSARYYFSAAITGTRYIMAAALPVMAIVLYVLWDALGVRFSQKWAFIPALLAIAYLDRSEEVMATVCRALERHTDYALGRLTHGIGLLIIGYIAVFALKLGVMGALIAWFGAECMALLVYEALLRRGPGLTWARPNWTELRSSLHFGLPLVPDRLAGWARLLATRPILAHAVPAAAVGLFSFASSLAAIPSLLANAIDLALTPIYYRRREDDDAAIFNTKIRSFGTVYAAGLAPLFVLMIAFNADAIRLIAGTAYAPASAICSVLLCASFVRVQSLFLIRQVQFMRKTWVLPAITIPSAVLVLPLTLVLAREYGVIAAAWLLVGVDMLIFLALALIVHRFEGLQYPFLTSVVLIAVVFACAVSMVTGIIGPANWASVGYRLFFVVATAAFCTIFWIWPNRALIQQLAAR
jgi:O-antigen/teichoic acid export membrane protein